MGSSCLTVDSSCASYSVCKGGMYCSYGGGYGGPTALYRDVSHFGGERRYNHYKFGYGSSGYSSHPTSSRSTTPTRGLSLPPSGLADRALRQRTVIRRSAREEASTPHENRNLRLKSPSIP